MSELNTLSTNIFDAIKASKKDELPRAHLGASIIGHPCDRWIWLSFRWMFREDFSGRMLRLFRRGQNEEAPMIADLLLAGLKISGTQDRFMDGHFQGSVDGIVNSGVPESPHKSHVLEIKTHNKKSFDLLEKNGVEKAKPLHFAQMQVYMSKLEHERSLYVAVCKDDDRIYTERVRIDSEIAEKLTDRAQRLIASDNIPAPLSTNASWFECKFCAAHSFCHKTKTMEAKDVHCRSCAHVTFKIDGKVFCEKWEMDIPTIRDQVSGCPHHVLHPDLVPWKMVIKDNSSVFWEIDGVEVQNGEHGASVFGSKEILIAPSLCAKPDEILQGLREDFKATIAGYCEE